MSEMQDLKYVADFLASKKHIAYILLLYKVAFVDFDKNCVQ